jgi:TIR domain
MSTNRHVSPQSRIRLFLSHSDVDIVLARRIRNLLTSRLNARVFTHDQLNAGEDWESKLRTELAEAEAVVALLTPHAVNSKWVLHEIGAAWGFDKAVIPVVTRRDVLNNLPVSLDISRVLEIKDKDLDNPEDQNIFILEFEDALAASHLR